jgi:hypothetical protein
MRRREFIQNKSEDRTPRWTTLMWRKTISPGPLPCTGSSQLAGLVQYPEPTGIRFGMYPLDVGHLLRTNIGPVET